MKISPKIFNIFILLIAMNFFYYPPAFSCKYTVRDIGFTDLGSNPYKLYLFYDNNTSQNIISAFETITYAALLETNIESVTININEESEKEALSIFETENIKTVPTVILVASNGSAIILPISDLKNDTNESVWQIVENVVISPIREKLINSLTTTYGIVLLFESKDEIRNNIAQNEVENSIENISEVMDIMPKPIKEAPKLLRISQKQMTEEKVLLWSLDINTEDDRETQVVILYGRGRRIGSVLTGNKITKNNVFSLLSIIGADCECGLDRSWMLGKMYPLRWERNLQTKLTKSLGFDVESPIVKAEMSQILSLAPSLQGKNKSAITPLTAYSEGIIKFDNSSVVPTVSPNQVGEVMNFEIKKTFRIGLLLGVGVILIVLVIGGIIIIRAKFKEN